jgi:hypothetical protein
MRSTVTVAASVLATHYVDLTSADAEARAAERLRDTGLIIFDGLAGRRSLLAFATRIMVMTPHRDSDSDGLTTIHDIPGTCGRAGYAGFGREELLAHTEGSSLPDPPRLMLLACQRPAAQGGECLLADGREMGMMIQISSNGSRLDRPKILDLLTERRPYRLTLSLYGATQESYDGMTRRRGSFRRFMRGLAAAHEAGLPMRINIVVSNRNAHEIPQMKAIADRFGIESFEYTNISLTIHGGGEVLPSQSREMLRRRKPYSGCNAGITHFHADPHGRASICKVGRDPQVDLITEGADGLRRLAAVADSLLTRHGGCASCALHKTCGTCMPLANLYRQAQAPPEVFCQHGQHRRR